MHAVIHTVTFNDDVSAAQAELSQLVPQVSAAPGFVAGYWIALSPSKGRSTVIFESEADAQALLKMTQDAPTITVTLDSVEVGEVLAHA